MHFEIPFHDLIIEKKTIFNLMGYNEHTIPEPFPEIINEVLYEIDKHASIKVGYVINEAPSFIPENTLMQVNQVDFELNKIVFHKVNHSEKIIFFVCTAGKGISEWSNKLMKNDDLIKGYIVDTIGSIIVETAMNKIQDDIETEMNQCSLKITNRYSPGYCGWNVNEQHKLFTFFPANFCGIKLTESALMYPVKSISGIIGVGKNVQKDKYTCHECDLIKCTFNQTF